MMELSVELASYDDTYEDLCYKFVEHFLWIASAMNRPGPDSMWDEEDGFYYDILRLPDGSSQRLKVRSMVGTASPVRHHGRRRMAETAGAARAGENAATRSSTCRSFSRASMPPGPAISGSRTARFWRW